MREIRVVFMAAGLATFLVFSHPITHIGIYSGNGHILHASVNFDRVVNSKMKYFRNYYGARRVRPSL